MDIFLIRTKQAWKGIQHCGAQAIRQACVGEGSYERLDTAESGKEDSLVICSNNLPFKYTSSFIKNGNRGCADRLENHTSSFHGFIVY